MSKADNLKDFLTDVADAIRAKKGSTALINPQDFSSEIASLSGGLEIVDMAETTATIEPNKVYVWGMVQSLDITLGASTDNSDFFAFCFRCSKPTMTSLTVNGATWADDTILDAQGKPVLDLGSWYQCEIKGGTSALYARLAHYIPFADSNVEAVLMSKGIGDGIGITYADAVKVTTISTWFQNNAVITSFDELRHFTKIISIIESAFKGCSALTEIALPASLTSIGNGAFNGCTKLAIASGLGDTQITRIGQAAFSGCSSLTEIALPASLTSMGNGAFNGCTLLKEIAFPPTFTTTGQYAFMNCKALTKASGLENTQVTEIKNEFFSGCSALTEIALPPSLTTIGNSAFNGCSALTEIAFPASLTTIGANAFQGCTSLVTASGLGDTQLTKIVNGAFNGCTLLKEIAFPPTFTTTGQYTFLNCKALTKASGLGNTQVTEIKREFFSGCSSLKEIALPASLTTIGANAFNNCKSLAYIVVKATTPPTIASNSIPSTIGAIYVPDESIAAYQAATNWSSFASKIKGISEMPTE